MYAFKMHHLRLIFYGLLALALQEIQRNPHLIRFI
jgi:hypothetical protein